MVAAYAGYAGIGNEADELLRNFTSAYLDLMVPKVRQLFSSHSLDAPVYDPIMCKFQLEVEEDLQVGMWIGLGGTLYRMNMHNAGESNSPASCSHCLPILLSTGVHCRAKEVPHHARLHLLRAHHQRGQEGDRAVFG